MRLRGTPPKPFQIGIKPLELSEWIDADERLGAYLAEKARLRAAHRNEVFAAEAETGPAQAEVLSLLADHLPMRFPALYRRHGAVIDVAGGAKDHRALPLTIAAPPRAPVRATDVRP